MTDRDIAVRYLRSIATVAQLRNAFWRLNERHDCTAIEDLLDDACMWEAPKPDHDAADLSALAEVKPTMAELAARIEALEKGRLEP